MDHTMHSKSPITHHHPYLLQRLAPLGLVVATACGTLEPVKTALSSGYHTLSGGTGVYLTIHRHATGSMVDVFHFCKSEGHSDTHCGTNTLRLARSKIEDSLSGNALGLWNGSYAVFGYHPHFGKGFRDAEGPDLAQAIRDLHTRKHACLRIHWKPSGTNWTTASASLAECKWGKKLG